MVKELLSSFNGFPCQLLERGHIQAFTLLLLCFWSGGSSENGLIGTSSKTPRELIEQHLPENVLDSDFPTGTLKIMANAQPSKIIFRKLKIQTTKHFCLLLEFASQFIARGIRKLSEMKTTFWIQPKHMKDLKRGLKVPTFFVY